MSITLADIWRGSPEQLNAVLVPYGLVSSGNQNYDRVVTALIYCSESLLDAGAAYWIFHPHFLRRACSVFLPEIPRCLVTPIIHKLLLLSVGLYRLQRHKSEQHSRLIKRLIKQCDLHYLEEKFEVDHTVLGILASYEIGIYGRNGMSRHWRDAIRDEKRVVAYLEKSKYDPYFKDLGGPMTDLLALPIPDIEPVGMAWYLFSLWDLIMHLPQPELYQEQLQKKMVENDAASKILERVMRTHLSDADMGQHVADDVIPLIQEYLGPPHRDIVMERLSTPFGLF